MHSTATSGDFFLQKSSSVVIGRIAIGYLLTIPLGLGVPGMWLGMMVEWGVRAVALRLRVKGERWLSHHA